MVERLKHFTEPTPTFSGWKPVEAKGLNEKLYDALAAFKIRTAFVAMHLDREWRAGLFRQLDSLMAAADWEATDPPPASASYSTFLRMLMLLRPKRRPGLGATNDGHLIAMWTSGDDRLTIECLPNDIARWHLSVVIDGERKSGGRNSASTPQSRFGSLRTGPLVQRWP